MRAAKDTTESPELADRFNRVLNDTVEALEESRIKYVFIGGIASGGLGRPRSTHDIDVFVRPEDAELALRALAKKGFRIEKTDPVWLYKGFKENILVDVIFKSKGEIYLDTEMYQKITTAEFHGKQLRLVSPEDLIIIKALAHSEATPNHWHDALALLSHATIDWDYLIRRARRAPRRVLSLLLYAQSNDIGVPKHVIDQFYLVCFGDMPPNSAASVQKVNHHISAPAVLQASSHQTSEKVDARPNPPVPASRKLRSIPIKHDLNAVAKLREHLAEDPRSNEMDILIDHEDDKFLLRGEVLTQERKDAVANIVQELYPDCEIVNQLRVSHYSEPLEAEEVK